MKRKADKHPARGRSRPYGKREGTNRLIGGNDSEGQILWSCMMMDVGHGIIRIKVHKSRIHGHFGGLEYLGSSMDNTLVVGQPRVAARRFNFEMGIGAIYSVYVYLLYFNNRKWLA